MDAQNIIKDILLSPSGSFASVLAFILGAFWLVHWVTIKVALITKDHNEFSKTNQAMLQDIKDIHKEISYLKGSFELMMKSKDSFLQSKSPITLNDKGEEVAKELGAMDIIQRAWAKIKHKIDTQENLNNAYDIQQFCIEEASVSPASFFEAHDLHNIKNYAFQKGEMLQAYMRIFGILIRDKYLSEKGINIDDVDTHDPNQKI
jgi:hypothetical protein